MTPAIDFGPPAASDFVEVKTGAPSPPSSPLSSQTLLSPPMPRNTNEGFLSVGGRRTTLAELAVTYPASVGLETTNSFGALSAVSLELPTTTSLQDHVHDTYGEHYGPIEGSNEGTPHQFKHVFDQETQIVGRAVAQVVIPPPPAMSLAQLMAFATSTAESVKALTTTSAESVKALITTSAETTANVTALLASIANLVAQNTAKEASILTLNNQIGDIDLSVGTSIICLENMVGANVSAIECLAVDIPPLLATVGDIGAKVDAVR